MSAITVAVLASVIVLTSGALVVVALGLVRQVKALKASLQAMQVRLEPTLAELDRETSIAERGLARLSQEAAQMRTPNDWQR